MRFAIFLLVAPLYAHMMSMSTGDATVTGNHVQYFLRMPLYEITGTRDPDKALLEHIRFSSGGRPARVVNQACYADQAHDSYLCAAYYEFPAPVDKLDIDCDLYRATVPNHVHLLRAEKDGKPDQAIFDYTFTHAELRFRPPTLAEIAFGQAAAGGYRAIAGWIQLLFLVGLALAARTWRELAALALMFAAGQIAGALIRWQPPVRFVECAAALTIAYLAVEILLLPKAGSRWLIAGVLGVFHGLYFALFLRESGYHAGYVLAGAVLGEWGVIAFAAAALLRLNRAAVRYPAAALLATGLAWFFVRLRG